MWDTISLNINPILIYIKKKTIMVVYLNVLSKTITLFVLLNKHSVSQQQNHFIGDDWIYHL